MQFPPQHRFNSMQPSFSIFCIRFQSHPIDVVKTRLQVSGDGTNGARNYKALGIRGTVSIIASEVRRHGIFTLIAMTRHRMLILTNFLWHCHSGHRIIRLLAWSIISLPFPFASCFTLSHSWLISKSFFISTLSIPLLLRRALLPSGRVLAPLG